MKASHKASYQSSNNTKNIPNKKIFIILRRRIV